MEDRMTKANRRMAIGLGIGVLLHFFLLVVHTLPFDIFPQKVETAANIYVNPFFIQNWALFAPAPREDYSFELNVVLNDGDTTGYFDPMAQVRDEHLAFPLNPTRQRLIVATNKTGVAVAIDLWNGVDSTGYPMDYEKYVGAKPLLNYTRACVDRRVGAGNWKVVHVRMHRYHYDHGHSTVEFEIFPEDGE